jgi:hypothetical protein
MPIISPLTSGADLCPGRSRFIALTTGRLGWPLRRRAATLVEALRDELLTQSVLHADVTPVSMLAPPAKRKTIELIS